jgi:transcriptional regulator with XRE-family HTH domain
MPVDDDYEIGRRLRAARDRAGLSREALAYHSGVSWSAIAQVEGGRRTNLRPRTLAALARSLGVTIDYLVTGSVRTPAEVDHRALLYESDAEFLEHAISFLAEAAEREEAVLAVTSKARIRRLRAGLGALADRVEFADRVAWYRTPGRAFDSYRRFTDDAVASGASWVRILGEPVWRGRSDAQVRLWARYESLINLAFSARPVTLLCPYDVSQLDPAVIEYARATHPRTVERDSLTPSRVFSDPGLFVLDS